MCDLIPGPLELQSNALPTELRGLWLQVNSKKLYLYLGWRGGDLTRETDQWEVLYA